MQQKVGASAQRRHADGMFAVWRENHSNVAKQSLGLLLGKPLSSLLTLTVLAIAIALPALLYIAVKNVETWAGYSQNGLEITAFLASNVTDKDALALSESIGEWQGIARTFYISPSTALQQLQKHSGLVDVAAGLEDNPIPASVVILLPDTANVGELAERIKTRVQSLPLVEFVRADLDWFKKAQAIVNVAQKINLGLIAVLASAVLLVIANTIKVAIESRKQEILVAKLVGATNSFVRRPFLYLGVWMGIGSAVFALLLVLLSYILIRLNIAPLEAAYDTSIALSGLSLKQGLLIVLWVGALGWLSAWAISHLQIRALEPR